MQNIQPQMLYETENKDEETGVDEGMKMGGGQFFPQRSPTG